MSLRGMQTFQSQISLGLERTDDLWIDELEETVSSMALTGAGCDAVLTAVQAFAAEDGAISPRALSACGRLRSERKSRTAPGALLLWQQKAREAFGGELRLRRGVRRLRAG
jgi:hypothetical protein